MPGHVATCTHLRDRLPETPAVRPSARALPRACRAALGLLSDRYDERTLPPGPRGLLFKQILPGLSPLLGTLREVARARRKTVPQVAINWCMTKGAVVIVGIKSAAQAEENRGALGWQLGPPGG